MIVMQFDVPEEKLSLLVVVIEPENLHRLQQADPISLESGSPGGYLKTVRYPESLKLLIAYEEEPGRLYEMIQQGRTADVIRDLMRGYRYTPADGKRIEGRDWKTA
jgi:hypothetical protein